MFCMLVGFHLLFLEGIIGFRGELTMGPGLQVSEVLCDAENQGTFLQQQS